MTASNAQLRPAGRIIAVASGKGGVGKTFIAASLAHAFAKRGERVLLFDGDLGMANIDVQLGLSPAADLGAVMAGEIALMDAVATALGGMGRGGFDVIAGRSGSGVLAGASMEEMSRLAAGLATVSLSYDRVIVDLAAGADPALMRLAVAADEVLVVLMDEPTAMTDAYAFVKMLRLRDEDAAPMVAVNMSESAASAKAAYNGFAKTCASFLDYRPPLAGVVRRDPNVKAAIRAQKPFLNRSPESEAAGDIGRLAASLSGERAAQAA